MPDNEIAIDPHGTATAVIMAVATIVLACLMSYLAMAVDVSPEISSTGYSNVKREAANDPDVASAAAEAMKDGKITWREYESLVGRIYQERRQEEIRKIKDVLRDIPGDDK